MPDGTYAPQSPDLSSFLSSASPKKSQTSSYTPRSPRLPPFATTGYRQTDPPQQLNSAASPHSALLQQQQQQNLRQTQYNYAEFGVNRQSQVYAPPIPELPPSHSFPQQQIQNFYQDQSFNSQQPTTSNPIKSEPHLESNQSLGAVGQFDMAARNKRGVAKNENGEGSGQNQLSDPGPSQGIEIKTKFPVARIKRIMQADEEVGKVAQVTPVAVSKALELFMISLVTRAASVAKTSSSKRVTAQHLKKAIETDEQFDFLNDIVMRVADGPDAGAKRVKSSEGSDDEMDVDGGKGRAGAGAAKKARGRRKKGE